jgi:hypothetical protein
MKYYVYTHAIPNGPVFYVGKGRRGRAFSSHKRSPAWYAIVDKYAGLTVHIVSYYETEKEALDAERMLIKKYRDMGASLVNVSAGGVGPSGFVQSEEVRLKKRLKLIGFKHAKVTCPKCGKTGGETSMKRWHFENCRGLKVHRARTTIGGKRVELGYYPTKKDMKAAILNAKSEAI